MNSLFSGSVAIPHPARRALAALLLATAALASGAAAATTYRIVELPQPPDAVAAYPLDINAAGAIVGYGEGAGGEHPLAWNPAPDYTPRWLPDGNGKVTRAMGINDAGFVIGNAFFPRNGSYLAVMWGPNDALVRLGELPEQRQSWAADLNANSIIGWILPNGTTYDYLPAFWSPPATAHVFIDDYDGLFGSVFVTALNDSGMVVGQATRDGEPSQHRAFRWTRAGGMQLLDQLPGSISHSTYDVNEVGQVAGSARFQVAGIQRAVLWNADDTVLDLGVIPGGVDYSFYEAVGISNTGEVAGFAFNNDGGFTGFLWTAATGMQDIVDLIDPLDPWYPQLQSGDAYLYIQKINDAGVMLGGIGDSSSFFGVVLVPQP